MAVNATAVYRVRVAGSNVNGGGYDPGIAGAGTDYSQQDAAQATGTAGTSTASTTFTDVGGVFTAAMVGNALWIASGAGATVGVYFITAYASATSITLDRASGTMTAAVWKIGGAWADPWTNTTTSPPIVPGNKIYIRGAGSSNPTSADYTATTYSTSVSGNSTNGNVSFIGENGRPQINVNGLFAFNGLFTPWENVCFFCTSATFASYGVIGRAGGTTSNNGYLKNCRFDQNGYDMICSNINGAHLNVEVLSSVAPRGTQVYGAIQCQNFGTSIVGCNIHDTNGPGITAQSMPSIVGNVIANCRGGGIVLSDTDDSRGGTIAYNTIYGNGGSGGIVTSQVASLQIYHISGNIISDHSGVSQGGIYYSGSGSSAQNARIANLIAFNTFYNNTVNISGFSVPAGYGNQTANNPTFTSVSTENFTPGSPVYNTGIPMAGNTLSGMVASVTYDYPGAVAPASSGGSVSIINRTTTIFLTGEDYAP